MSVIGIFTNIGIDKSKDAALDLGFLIKPLAFSVSDVSSGLLDPTKTVANAGEFYKGPISSRVVVDQNTIKFICTVPPGEITPDVDREIKEIYIFAEDDTSTEFMLAYGNPVETIIYSDSGSTTIELHISLTNVDLTSNFLFAFTQATELAEHNTDPNAHPEMITAMNKAGIFLLAGGAPFEYAGQDYDEKAEFDGTNATAVTTGVVVTFTSTFKGTETNTLDLVFDGIKTVDEVRAEFNAANFPYTVEHDGVGTEVPPVQTQTLSGGTYSVLDTDIVYQDTDGLYKKAIADGTKTQLLTGLAKLVKRCVVTSGLMNYDTVGAGFAQHDILYLSTTLAGEFTTINTGIELGLVVQDGMILFTGFNGAGDSTINQTFDATVSDTAGIGFFPTTQGAINSVSSPARILVDKFEDVKNTISTSGKTIEFVFNGLNKGWQKFAGQVASFRIDFDSVPDNGTWRLEWNSQESADLAFNAVAATIQTEFNLFSGHSGVIVTGDYTAGFVFTFLDEIAQPLPTFLDPGLNEIQRFNFGNIPDNGTVQFDFEAQTTINFPWDDDATDLKIALENLSTINEVDVTGSFASQFYQIEFIGIPFDSDGLQPQSDITVVMGDLDLGGSPTLINGIDPQTTVPISPVTLQQGKYKANNLRVGPTAVILTTTENSAGEPIGPDTAIILDAANIKMSGLGLVKDFTNGIDVNDQEESVISLRFENVDNPILSGDKIPGISADFSETLGYAKDVFSQLRLTEHPSNKKRLKVSTSDVSLPTGVELIKEIEGLLLSFDGAEIDFSTGEIFESDGTTPLGLDFSPVIPASQLFRFASIAVIEKVQLADQTIKGQLEVTFASGDGASEAVAPKAGFDSSGISLGQVVLEGDLGLAEISRIITVGDFFGSLDATYFILEDDVGTVAFWIDVDDSGTSEPVHGAARSIEITTIVESDDPNTVATKVRVAVNADSKFSASVSTNRVIVTDASIGPRIDIDAGTTGFFVDVQQQGIDTDATGLVDISNKSIKQLVASGGIATGAFQEKLGVGNGVTTDFPILSGMFPVTEESILVFSNVASFITTDWIYNAGSNQIEFVVAPVIGVEIYVFYLTKGKSISMPSPSGTQQVEYRTISSGEDTAKQLTLIATPATANKTVLDVITGSSQEYIVDFTVSGAILSWNGLGLDGVLSQGDRLRIQYFS